MSAAGADAESDRLPLRVPPRAGGDRRRASVRNRGALDDVSLRWSAARPRAARGERRRQEHAGQVHHGLLPGRRGPGHASAASRRASPARATRAALGIGMVYQHFTLVEDDDRRREPGAVAATATRSCSTGPRSTTASPRSWTRCRSGSIRRSRCNMLAAGEKQKLEILKQLYLRQLDRDPRRADLGADAGRGRRGAGPAARHGRGGA